MMIKDKGEKIISHHEIHKKENEVLHNAVDICLNVQYLFGKIPHRRTLRHVFMSLGRESYGC